MKINELKSGMNDVVIKAKVAEVTEPKQITTKFGTQTSLTNITLEDDTGTIPMALWGMQSEGITEGIEVEVSGGFTKEFRGTLQLGVGKNGSIKPVE